MPKRSTDRISKFVSIVVLFVGLFGAASCSDSGEKEATSPPANATRPNIVLVVSDALRQDVLGCYGGSAETPNLDTIAANGVLFENAYSTSPWTPPSSVSIFTGNYATSYAYTEVGKTMQVFVPEDETFLAEVLRDEGYDTAIRPGNYLIGLHNCLQGFEVLPNELWITRQAKGTIDRITGAAMRDAFGYPNSYNVLNRLMSIPKGKNFFITHWMLDPHEPLEPAGPFANKIRVDASSLTQPPQAYTRRKNIEGELNDAETAYLKARYIAEVESVDERVGYIIKMLAHKNVLRSTYFVFTADHGELFGEHGLFGHAINYFEELVRVPLIVVGPGVPRGKRVDSPVSLVGLMPTLKELVGADYDDHMQGESFADILLDDVERKGPLYFDDIREHERVDALLDGDYKLVVLQDETCELYDLSKDPGEMNNIAASQSDKVEAMLETLLTMREANSKRQDVNLTRYDSEQNELSPEDAAELEKQLRALGYVQ